MVGSVWQVLSQSQTINDNCPRPLSRRSRQLRRKRLLLLTSSKYQAVLSRHWFNRKSRENWCGSPTKIFKSILWFKAEKLPNVLPADPSVQGTRCTRIKNSPQNTQNQWFSHEISPKVSTKIIPKSFIEPIQFSHIQSIQNVWHLQRRRSWVFLWPASTTSSPGSVLGSSPLIPTEIASSQTHVDRWSEAERSGERWDG